MGLATNTCGSLGHMCSVEKDFENDITYVQLGNEKKLGRATPAGRKLTSKVFF